MAKKLFNRPHLRVPFAPSTSRFTSVQAGGGRKKFKQHDRASHGAKLQNEFENALPQDEEEDAVIRIEFQSEPGFDLELKSLDSARKGGFELLNVRRGAGNVTFATVLVPRKQLKHFRTLFADYIAKNSKKGSPAHQALVESIATIRRAGLQSLWTDPPDEFPTGKEPVWVELWLRKTASAAEGFRATATKLGIATNSREVIFVDRVATMAFGSVEQLGHLIEEDETVAEVRRAKLTAADFMELTPREKTEWTQDLATRVQKPPFAAPAVCLLDTGVNNGHVLLQPVIPNSDLMTCDPTWRVDDHHGHGTEMAGLALFGDLVPLLASGAPVALSHGLESVKLLPPPPGQNKPEAYGALTKEAVARAEVQSPKRERTVCLTVASTDKRDRGRPSSWSAAVDQLASGADDGQQRLLCVAAGNVSPDDFLNYPASNQTDSIHDPGQSWNALTVGALADRDVITDPTFSGWSPIAPLGDLCPSSTTSLVWAKTWPLKPEIVMPGGNAAVDPGRTEADFTDCLSLLSTHWKPLQRPFTPTGETSAASALAARLAALVQARYPHMWPETVRALLVHSAEWTGAMLKRFPKSGNRVHPNLLRCYGFGVPNRDMALYSADNAVTLVSEHWIQPYDERITKGKTGKRKEYVTREMHLHKLPWPTDVLRELGAVDVELRITLSYFVEPSPGERGWKNRHRYASHGLRFDIQTATETRDAFMVRINKAAREDDEKPTSSSDASAWSLGPDLRSAGSIHSDIWTGPAVDLAARNHLAVYPTIGWWRERHHLGRWNQKTRYALVVSIRAPEIETDIYTPIASLIPTSVPVPIPSAL